MKYKQLVAVADLYRLGRVSRDHLVHAIKKWQATLAKDEQPKGTE